MKRLFLLWMVSVFVSGGVMAQESELSGDVMEGGDEFMTSKPVELGRDLRTGKPLPGVEYDFGRRVERSRIDPTSQTVTIELRDVTRNQKYLQNRGVLLVLDVKSRRVRWTREVGYPWGRSGVTQQADFLTYNDGRRTFCLDLGNGQPLWESKYDFWYLDLDSAARIGCGYPPVTNMAPETLCGVALNTGEMLWKRKIRRENWDNVVSIDDSTVLIVANGLHQLNLFTGEGWDYTARTSQRTGEGAKLLANTLGIASAVFLGGGFFIWGGSDYIRGLGATPLVTDDAIFFSCADRMAALDRAGNLRWERPLPEGIASYSHLFESDTVIYLVGRGLAFLRGATVTYGRPFFAAYGKTDGRLIFSEVIDQRKCQIRAMDIRRDSMMFVTEDRIAVRSLENGRDGREIALDTSLYGAVIREVDPEHFFRRGESDGRFAPVVDGLDSWGVYTTRNKLLLLDGQLDIRESFELDSLYYLCERYDNLTLLRRDSTTYVVDDNGTARAELISDKAPMWIGDHLYFATFRGIVQIDMTDIVRNRYAVPEAPSNGILAELPDKRHAYIALTD